MNAVRAGDLTPRARVRGTRDEYDELAEGLNDMLDRHRAADGRPCAMPATPSPTTCARP